MSALVLDRDDLRMQIFCRSIVEIEIETYNIVAYLDAYEPGMIFVGVNDDNDYPDERYLVTSVDKIVAMQFRKQHGEYPWEVLIQEAEQALRATVNG